MPAFIQSSTQQGLVVKVASSNLTDKEGYLVKLVDGTGDATVALSGNGELALFVVEDGGASGANVTCRPLDPNRNVRIISSGTIAGGAIVASDANGKIEAASSGDYAVGVLEEDAVAGQYALVRPFRFKLA